MNELTAIGVLAAFGAGVLSFLSPCVLPLIPSYVTFITELGLDELPGARRQTLVHALLFIAGFTIVFLALGASASALGRVVLHSRDWIARIGGVLLILFGLFMLGVFNPGWFSAERRVHLASKPAGMLGTMLVGVAFAAGWTPCIGPILGGILVMASSTESLAHGVGLLFAYSMGLAVPFVIAALAVDRFVPWLTKHRSVMLWAERVGGVTLVAIGLLLVTNYFTLLASYLQALTPEFIRSRI